ncbi:PREDICTED: olfactory receptor 5V1-like [Nanorana parkeri]|uniref:olfactory receptor 5V1-like n=1 Tax=Nanorana parkeri TaxID=125878 RepID=UPI000854439F|nr:PREDICTED: olfactory receptor 5V1-like [Nanorana parkeri]
MLIIGLGCGCQQLKKPMFFFLMNLSVVDICFSSVTMPWTIYSLLEKDKTISLPACVIQMYSFLAFTSSNFLLLSAMAYDRYVAICEPLHYNVTINKKLCVVFASCCWLVGFADTLPHAYFALIACYSRSNRVNHFFYDLTALMKLSCSETYTIETITYVEGAFLGFGPFLLTLTSYIFIIKVIFKIRSTKGRAKTFSTCSSHLIVVAIFYSTTLSMYVRPTSSFLLEDNKVVSLVFVMIIPSINPLIYSLRNNELKQALIMKFKLHLFRRKKMS